MDPILVVSQARSGLGSHLPLQHIVVGTTQMQGGETLVNTACGTAKKK